jgi:hypothetical protein
MATRIIRAVSATHEDEDGVEQEVRQGDEVELTSAEEARLDAQGALVPHGYASFSEFYDHAQDAYRAARGDTEAAQRLGQRAQPAPGGVAADTAGGISDISAPSDVPRLAAYIRDEKPNADDTVALAQGDPAKARIVLEAETAANGGEPRKGVESALEKIIAGGGE